MDNFQKLQRTAYHYLLLTYVLVIAVGVVAWVAAMQLHLTQPFSAAAALASMLLAALIVASVASKFTLQPLHVLWQAILHVAPDTNDVPAPNMEELRLGHELVNSLALRVYQYASQEDGSALADHRKEVLQAVNIVNHFPLPLFVFNKQQLVTNASESALNYLDLESPELFGKPIFDTVNLEFASEHTLETWIEDCQQNKVTDQAYWQRVRVRMHDGKTVKQCDIAAYYNRDNQSGTEFIVTLFDHTELYDQDDQSLSFIALAVHELRTPLTVLRGYIEVFEEELTGKLAPELEDYLRKLRISSDQLSAFVSNILNVMKVEENQLVLQLTEGNWDTILHEAAANLEMRARVLGITIKFAVDPQLPTVAVDRVSIWEVVSNLLDNAIKYSGQGKEILITAQLNAEGMVETTIQDFGVGIPESVLPNLFDKFYRNHRTRAQIGGTGLGLYLTKALVTAHGGQIWVKSKVGVGTIFGFTLKPYAHMAEELKASNNHEIVRQAHGWIKNHSYNRR